MLRWNLMAAALHCAFSKNRQRLELSQLALCPASPMGSLPSLLAVVAVPSSPLPAITPAEPILKDQLQ